MADGQLEHPDAVLDQEGFEWRQGLDGLRATIAELHAHRAFAAADPSAVLVGGNAAIRDHELLGNSAWANTKTAWPHDRDGRILGFSPVRWATARDPHTPDRQLDLVALVPIQAEHLEFRDTGANRLEVHWTCERFWVVPASVLQAKSAPDGRSTARSLIALTDLATYAIDTAQPLTAQRLRQVAQENVVATDTPDPAN